MKRTIDSFFVKTVRLRPDPEQSTGGSDTEPSTSQVVSSPGLETASSDNEPRAMDSEAEPTEIKKGKIYTFRREWLDQFPWLRYSKADSMMHCTYCKECGKTMAGNTAFVTGCNTFRIETLKKHNASAKHTTCRDKCTAQVPPLPAAFQRQAAANASSDEAGMIIKFNVAYHIAKEELPFTKFKAEIILQRKNGVNVNPTYSNDVACAQFIGVIGDTFKKKTSVEIANCAYMAFLIDGDTDVSTKECVIVYGRILQRGRPVNMLIGHIEVEHAHAQGIYAASKKAFAALGDQCSNWLEKVIALGADGAAVNLGRKGGVIALLQQEAGDHIVPFHCMPHRLELAILSVQRDNPMMAQLYDLLHLIWKTYHFSPKSMRELRVIGADLGVNVLMPSGVKGTRWLPHVSRALETFLKPGQFTAVYYHMDHLAGSSANADIAGRATKASAFFHNIMPFIRATYTIVKKSIEDATFVAFCHFITDVFSGISKFSLLLQRNDIILPQAVCSLEKLLLTTEAMVARPKPDGRLSEFLADMRLQRRQQQEEGDTAIYKFQTITLKGEASKLAGDDVAATKLTKVMDATIKSTVKHLNARFNSLLGNASESDTTKAVKCFNIFNHDSWPENQQDLVDHGADDLGFLLDHFSTVLRRNGVNTELAKEEFVSLKLLIARMFKDKTYLSLWELMLTREPYCSEHKNILHLVHIMLVLPVSAAVCERGFSTQKRIKSDTRASLHSDTVEDLIRISVEGPSLEDFDARESVASWFSQGQRTRRPNYRTWPSEVHVAAMQDGP
ncbi:Zinc finger protein 862 [Merluccius polli]|uniref:Zinc finger protein 862 n=1 Tax=Merluccius polli TaxID=89951 RepID=A0AA47MWU0_MERPO|nr:Zinc finger protein 862 [Merluccius polli]